MGIAAVDRSQTVGGLFGLFGQGRNSWLGILVSPTLMSMDMTGRKRSDTQHHTVTLNKTKLLGPRRHYLMQAQHRRGRSFG